MNLQEAIEVLKVEKGVAELDISNDHGNIHTEEFVQACDLVLEEVEKQIPKNALEIRNIYDHKGNVILKDGYCPSCKEEITNKYQFCNRCGQEIDWSDKK